MKTGKIYAGLLAVVTAFLLTSCGELITLASWKNPESTTQISKVAVMPLFEKLEYVKPFEEAIDIYFEKKGLKSMGSLDFLNPNIKYPIEDIKRKCDSLGIDGILVFIYKGTQKTENYVPETTTYYGNSYGGYWGGGYWGAGYYGGYYGTAWGTNTVTTGGYWTTTSVLSLEAHLYTRGSKGALWSGEITVTDPEYIDRAALTIAKDIYSSWLKYGLLKSVATK